MDTELKLLLLDVNNKGNRILSTSDVTSSLLVPLLRPLQPCSFELAAAAADANCTRTENSTDDNVTRRGWRGVLLIVE